MPQVKGSGLKTLTWLPWKRKLLKVDPQGYGGGFETTFQTSEISVGEKSLLVDLVDQTQSRDSLEYSDVLCTLHDGTQ